MRRLLLLCLMTLLSFATWAYDFKVDGLCYNKLDDSSVEVTTGDDYTATGGTPEYTGEITIPESVTYEGVPYAVIGIAQNAFRACSGLTKVVIPNSVTTLGTYTFYNSKDLTSVTLGSGISGLSNYMFASCTGLATIEIPSNITSIGTNVFQNSGLAEITIPENIYSIGNYAFDGCSSLTKVTFAKDGYLSSIGTYAFRSCTKLTEIELPDRLAKISNYTFYSCTALEKVVLCARISSIGTYAFNGCTALASMTSKNVSPPSVSNSNSFSNIPFTTCVLYVPTQSIDSYKAASRWSSFTNVEGIGNLPSVATSSYTDVTGTTATLVGTFDAGEETIIEQGFEYYLTSDANNIQRVVATSISDGEMSAAATGLTKGSSYTFYAYATTENGTIYGSEMNFMTYGYDVEVDGFYYNIISDTDLTVEVIWGGSGKASGTTSYAGDLTIPSTTRINEQEYKVIGIGDCAFYNCKLTSLIIPNSVTYIGESAFYGCSSLANIEFPESLTSIGVDAFDGCIALTEITIPNLVTKLENKTFYRCSGLTNIVLPEGLVSMGSEIFYNCTSLTSIELPGSLVSMDYGVFQNTSLAEITIPENVTSLGSSAFQGCSSLVKAVLPADIATIEKYLFYQCSSLEEVSLPENATSIENDVFYQCTALPDIIIPKGVTAIGDRSFFQCTLLLSVSSLNPEPPTCGANVFEDLSSECVLYVPTGCVDVYKEADTWKDFFTIEEISSPIVTTLDATEITMESATLNGTVEERDDVVIEKGFEWWLDTEEVNKIILTDSSDEAISTTIENLTKNTPYTYRAYAKTEKDTYYGSDVTFSTANWDCDFYVDGIYYNYGKEEATCEVTYRDTGYNSYYGVVNVPEKTTYNNIEYTIVGVGESAFRESTELTEALLPNTVAYINAWAFYNCSALTEMIIPNAVTEIGNQAFNDCEELTSVTIGSGVESIGSNSFNCSNLQEIYTLNPEPPVCDDYAFRSVNKESCALYVPDRAYETYYVADVWKDFYNMIEMKVFRVETLEATDITETSAVLNGTAIEAWDEPGSISTKGFVYWDGDPNVITTIIISDESEDLSYTLESLSPETTYTYRAFAITASGTTYGEDVEFTTLEDTTTGINGIHISLDDENVEGIYSTSGQKLNTTVKGVNIIRYSDGSVKKIYVK